MRDEVVHVQEPDERRAAEGDVLEPGFVEHTEGTLDADDVARVAECRRHVLLAEESTVLVDEEQRDDQAELAQQ